MQTQRAFVVVVVVVVEGLQFDSTVLSNQADRDQSPADGLPRLRPADGPFWWKNRLLPLFGDRFFFYLKEKKMLH